MRDAEAAETFAKALGEEWPEAANLLAEAEATFVPTKEARELGLLGPDAVNAEASSVPDPMEVHDLRSRLLLTLKEIGQLQTGDAVSLGWCSRAAALIAEEATGECDFDLHTNDHIGALTTILRAAVLVYQAERQKANPPESDIPF